MKAVINNNNKYELEYCFAMLYMHGRKFMIVSLFTNQRLFLLIFQNLGTDFCAPKSGYQSQKRPVLPPENYFLWRKMMPKIVVLQLWKKFQVLEKKIFWKKKTKKSFQLICTDKTYKTVCRNFLKINGCQVFRWGTHFYVSLFPSICLSIVHHFSGTVHHQIIIFDTHV